MGWSSVRSDLSPPHLRLPRDAQVVRLIRDVDEQPVGDVRTNCHQVPHLCTVTGFWTYGMRPFSGPARMHVEA